MQKLKEILFIFVVIFSLREGYIFWATWSVMDEYAPTHRMMSLSTVDVPFKVLALGGSVTWGVNVDRMDAYPNLLHQMNPNFIVRNLAIRATGSSYPRLCLESMIDDDETYDLITLEFTLNGLDDFESLLKRLKERYPTAILIYIDLYSIKAEATDDNGLNPKQRGLLPNLHWTWSRHQKVHDRVLTYLNALSPIYNMHVYSLPRANTPMKSLQLFSADWHHLSRTGHAVVARAILRRVENIKKFREIDSKDFGAHTLGSWGNGDICESWFETGKTKLNYSGMTMNYFAKFKFGLELNESSGGVITFENSKKIPMPVYIGYMSKAQFYPEVNVTIGNMVTTINPRIDSSVHINSMKQVGLAPPGINLLQIETEEVKNGSSNYPFRITSVILCGTCEHVKEELVVAETLVLAED